MLYKLIAVLSVDVYIDTFSSLCMEDATLDSLLAINGRERHCLENVRGPQNFGVRELTTHLCKTGDPFLTLIGFSGAFSGMLDYRDRLNGFVHFLQWFVPFNPIRSKLSD